MRSILVLVSVLAACSSPVPANDGGAGGGTAGGETGGGTAGGGTGGGTTGGGTGGGGATCLPDGGVTRVCSATNPLAIVNQDSCGGRTLVGNCASTAPCTVLADAGVGCVCPLGSNPQLKCHTAGAVSGPAETTLGLVNSCGMLLPEVVQTCLIGERCWYTFNADAGINPTANEFCASSMDPSQRMSAFYPLACDDDLYMAATTSLEMDCRCNRANTLMQECRPGSDAWTAGLRRGVGPNAYGINLAKWGGGFIHQGELYAVVHYTNPNVATLKPGAIYAFNLTNGNRRVVSGSYLDPTSGRVDVGSGYTPQGEALPFLVDAKLGTDGKIYTMGSDTLNNVEITRVDPQTGARTLVWRRQSLAEASTPSYPYGQCFDGRVSTSYASGFLPVQPDERAFALATDGSFFVGWKADGVGVMRISADGTTCTHVSRWASNNTTQPLPNIGTGLTPQYGTISGLLHRGGVVYAFTNSTLLAINDTTGNRTAFSTISTIGGIGETNFFVDENRQLLFACGTSAARKCSVHSLANGNTAQGLFSIGVTQPVLPGKYSQLQGAKGALDNNNYNGYGAVALDPTNPNVLYFVILAGLVRYEIDTGNSYIMSM